LERLTGEKKRNARDGSIAGVQKPGMGSESSSQVSCARDGEDSSDNRRNVASADGKQKPVAAQMDLY
jgi:hypothetical protein